MGNVKKWVEPVWSRDSKISCIRRMSQSNKLISLHANRNSQKLKMVKNGCGQSGDGTRKYTVSQE